MNLSLLLRPLLVSLGIGAASGFILRSRIPSSDAVCHRNPPSECHSLNPSSLYAQKDDSKYQFGDISRWIGKRIKQTAENITGKEYEFGDLTKFAVSEAIGSTAANYTGKEKYEFGDLTRLAMSTVSSKVTNYTGKDSYQVGDMTKAIMQRIEAGEYSSEDVWLAFKVLLSASFTLFSPVASALPIKLLIDAINFGLSQEVSARLMTVLAEMVDQRLTKIGMAEALTNMAKQGLVSGVSKFTGKDSYEVGDITRAVRKIQNDSLAAKTKSSSKRLDLSSNELLTLAALDPQTKGS